VKGISKMALAILSPSSKDQQRAKGASFFKLRFSDLSTISTMPISKFLLSVKIIRRPNTLNLSTTYGRFAREVSQKLGKYHKPSG
jgi:hypothetical protein